MKTRSVRTENCEALKMDESIAKRKALHYMLATALIEIRASNTLNAAQKIADVFHNLPMGLLKCSASEDYDAEYAKLLQRAKRSGFEGYVRNLMVLATRTVSEKVNEDN
ncbi:hypothetical protein [Arenimonas alkanexedens]